ncbi:MAG TPA: hypothetical protein VL987_11990 [Cellvibrio sp.]|nr:hypothetical protein [Cellvibrio sp.]
MFDIRPYQFLEWEAGHFCCGDYVALVLRDYLGATLPEADYQGGAFEAARVLANYSARNHFRRIEKPTEFSVVEMQRFRAADHVGVCVLVDGQLKITHCENGSGVLITSFDDIQLHYKILAFYEYCPV